MPVHGVSRPSVQRMIKAAGCSPSFGCPSSLGRAAAKWKHDWISALLQGFYKDIAERLPIHGAACDTGIFQKFIKYFFRNLFLPETAICAAADAKCMEVHGTGLI